MSHDEKANLEFDYGQNNANTVPDSTDNIERAEPNDLEGERRVRRAIEDAAPRNVELLNEIMSTHDAVDAVQNNEVRLQHLDEELVEQSKLAHEASLATKTQLAKYRKSRDSFTRKWIYILTNMRGNLQRKVKEGEEAYHEALAAQSRAEQREQNLKQDKDAVELENAGFVEQAKKHGAAHEEIDKLYSKLFDGQTPGFPDEDEREESYRSQKDEHDATIKTLKATTSASKELALLKSTIIRAQKEKTRAKYELETSLFRGTEYAIIFLDRCARLIEQAVIVSQKVAGELPKPLDADFVQTHHSLVQHLVNARASATDTLSAGYAYNSSTQVFSSIQAIRDELTLAAEAHTAMAHMIKSYETAAKQAVKITSRGLEDSRQALQEIRQNAFEVTVGYGAAAPAYHECCDRAEGFESDANAQSERIPDPIIDDSDLPPPPSYDRAVAEG